MVSSPMRTLVGASNLLKVMTSLFSSAAKKVSGEASASWRRVAWNLPGFVSKVSVASGGPATSKLRPSV